MIGVISFFFNSDKDEEWGDWEEWGEWEEWKIGRLGDWENKF